jgi:endonuclease YncB( thermonuclease family)
MKTILSIIVTLLAMVSVEARTLQGKVTRIIDGNTLEFLSDEGDRYTILLSGIDCPELTQAFGDEAKICLEKLTLNKKASINISGKDRSGNTVAEVLIDGKKDPRIQLLKEGLAWTTETNADSSLESQRAASQSKKKGLWKEENPTPPWTHRRQQSMLEAKSS